MSDEFVWMFHPETGGQQRFPTEAVSEWAAKGWRLLDADPTTDVNPTRQDYYEALEESRRRPEVEIPAEAFPEAPAEVVDPVDAPEVPPVDVVPLPDMDVTPAPEASAKTTTSRRRAGTTDGEEAQQ